ncbi:hypothetical protein ABZY31_08950 [Streptomyces sp. NPDC006529]|uniref:hypothetical protein n=1 Tax=Streptomyces sp. NPDC006529 TaxID=3157177 RepID=UPI0033AA9AD2
MRQIPTNEAFGHVDHPHLRRQVRDPRSDREGELMAVVEEYVGTVAGAPQHTRTAFVRAPNGLEFTAAPDTLVRL